MRKYRRKNSGAVIEAVQLQGDNVEEVAVWCKGFIVEERDAIQHDLLFEGINVKTPSGNKRLSRGGWVMKWNDSFFVISDHSFQGSYELIEEKPSEFESPKFFDDPFEGMPRISDDN